MSSLSAINGSVSVAVLRQAPQRATAPHAVDAALVREADTVEISDAAQEASAVRGGLVSRVRDQLADGAYLHPDKLDIAIDRLLRDLNG